MALSKNGWVQPVGIADVLTSAKSPPHIAAILEALQFALPPTDRLGRLLDKEWMLLLDWCDTRQLTLLLPYICEVSLPPQVRENIFEKTRRYEIRFERLKASLFEIADAFQAANLDYTLLKGLSHAPAMTPNALLRAQGDIDLWLQGPSVYKAQEVLQTLGYVSMTDSKSRHLGPMARPSSWRWRNDLFDPDMPVSVELHYELWSAETEYVDAPQLGQFWARRTVRDFDGHNIPVLCDPDLLGFSCLHLLLHLLHGDLPLQRAWEIARFLDMHADDERFWGDWRTTHCPQLRQLETPMYYLVRQWFGCRLPQSLNGDVANLSPRLRFWLDNLYLSPLINEWRPNKREVWMHLALITDRKNKLKILLRRLFPMSLPPANGGGSPLLLARRLRFIASRLVRHFVTLAPTIFDGIRFTRWSW